MVIIKESSPTYRYHVFLSFRGEDTRNNFTGHLYSALREKGIFTFMDDLLIRGEEISPALIKAIERSKILIVVFSENYASSKWCLDELVKILDCKKKNQQIVLPVFYKVDPSDMRNHRGSFGEGLANLKRKFKDKDQVQEWKTALFEAASLSGWHLDEHLCESRIIREIVEDVSKKHVNSTNLDVAEYQVGIKHRVQAIQKLLGVEGRGVHMVGIWGAGGIGKTTIAKAVYNSIAQKFDGSCFLENVREHSKGARGLVELQKILLREILKERNVEVTSVARGISMIKERLQYKSVLLVIDDVSDMNQLNNLARQCSWFGKGSRIIITTRDKTLLRCHSVDLTCEVQELDNHEALELLSVNAFKRIRSLDGYAELTKRAVRYTQGLPLALTVLGSSLRGGNVELWEAALDGSESREIKDVLKISFDGLDDRVKKAFLGIACSFKGEDTECVIKTLEEHFINVLIEKALISVRYGGKIWMHDLIEEMGRDIVHQLSPNDPRNRSRLWSDEDVHRVLTYNIGTNNVDPTFPVKKILYLQGPTKSTHPHPHPHPQIHPSPNNDDLAFTKSSTASPSQSYAKILSNSAPLSFDIDSLPTPTRENGRVSVQVSETPLLRGLESCKTFLVGRFLFPPNGVPPKAHNLAKRLRGCWPSSQNWSVTPLGKGFYMLQFQNREEMQRVWSLGSINLNPGLLRLIKWTPSFSPATYKNTFSRVWVRFWDLNFAYWDPQTLFEIACGVGTPIKLDPNTENRTVGLFAKVLIDVDFSKPVPNKLQITSSLGMPMTIDVQLESKPDFCDNCGIVGHVASKCKGGSKVSEGELGRARSKRRRSRSSRRMPQLVSESLKPTEPLPVSESLKPTETASPDALRVEIIDAPAQNDLETHTEKNSVLEPVISVSSIDFQPGKWTGWAVSGQALTVCWLTRWVRWFQRGTR